MNTTQISVDLAKSVFEVAVSEVPGRVTERHRLSRARFRQFFEGRPRAHVLMEACGSAHYWGREIQALGHEVSLLHGGDAARYRDGNKTDRAALHRLRQGYLRARTARINAVRGHLREFGILIPVGAARVVPCARAALAEDVVPAYLRLALEEAVEEIVALDAKAEALRRELERLAHHMPDAQLLMTVPGIGVLTATALLAFVGDIHRFRSGRNFAAYLGLTPREHSTGHVRHQGRITKRGNSYVRMMLVHGARSALRAGSVSTQPDDLRSWALGVHQRRGHNVAAVALANKLARVCWRVWRDRRPFERREAP